MIAFGPVPSRRLGRSLGINNIPPKICTYSCVYCQVGRTINMQVERRAFYDPEQVLRDIQDKVARTREAGETVDYLTFVPDGEPTLDINLGREIELLRPLGVRVAVICNSSLIWREDVRQQLMGADWVSLKMDSVQEAIWRGTNRPHGSLRLSSVLEGALAFASEFEGTLATETMLVRGVNDSDDQIRDVAEFVARLAPSTAYLAIPTRPPAEDWVQAPDEETVNRAYQIFCESVDQVEYLIGYEGNAFAFTGDVKADLLSITAVHPMRSDAVDALLKKADVAFGVVDGIVADGHLVRTEYDGHTFYTRTLPGRRGRTTP